MSDTARKRRRENEPEIADIFRLKGSDGAAAESERLLRLITDRSPVSICYCGADRVYKFVNKLYAERFGMRPQDIIGRTIRDVFGEAGYAEVEPYLDAVLSGKQV